MEGQRIVEHLAHELARSVVVVDREGAVVGVSYRADDYELLQRGSVSSPTDIVQDWFRETARGAQHRGRGASGAEADASWITVPLLVDGDVTGWALIAARDQELRSTELAVVDIAAELLWTAHSRPTLGGEGRRTVLRNLLDADPGIRRASLRRASKQRWVDRHDKSDVHALVYDDEVGPLERLRLTHALCRNLPGRAEVLRERDDAVFIITSRVKVGSDIDALIRAWALSQQVALKTVGTAALRPEDEDLARSAHAALTAAELSQSIPELADVTSGDGLGGWALLQAVKGHRGLLAVASPAAELLCALGDTNRETVEAYLDAAGHVRAACEQLHIHRTTLYYRLDNLPDLVKAALADGMQRSTLHLALKLDRLWAAAGV
ncbi:MULTISPECIES: PucR family transcriptional regulator [Microbacterium]|uniref:PucR C-terminal helix-turn-helix domain-containing protein n=1 Tax=Microbacterium trichothecenolyticum TaxID=69370 RepID=A0A0M2HDK8_MICTR|nr:MULTISPECIES: helix-turn-helix domain-containing protein [Microbacterium]KJL42267.1 hypothetical protein RS82_02283 [Microbacterium trichothecenolyticum]MDR7187931.1 hypothetical protein [Microbacterium sp. BE35]